MEEGGCVTAVRELAPFAQVQREVVLNLDVSSHSIRVWLLLWMAGLQKSGSAQVAVRREDIGETLGMSLSAVKRCIKNLEATGALRVEHVVTGSGQGSNRYYLPAMGEVAVEVKGG